MSFFDFKKIIGSKSDSAIGVDIGSSSIKVIELKKEHGKAVLKAYGEIALGPYSGGGVGSIPSLSTTKLAEALRDVLHEASIKTKESGVAIPFKSSLVTLIEMPPMTAKKLEEAIPIEARKYIPVPISEVTLDWWVVPEEKYSKQKINQNPKTEVLVISIHNEILNNYNNLIKENSLNTSFFEIEMFSSMRSLMSGSEMPTLILDFGALGTKLYILEKGLIRGSHIINKGSQDITQGLSKSLGVDFAKAEKIKRNVASLKPEDQKTVGSIIDLTLNYIWSESRNILGNYERKYERKIGRVILTGGGVSLSGFADMCQKELSIKSELGNPFEKVVTPSFISLTLKETGHEFAVAVGCALRKLEENS